MTYSKRNKVYGDNYKKIGAVLKALFPVQPELNTADDCNRFALFMMLLVKMSRYAESLSNGGHADSAHDMVVYAAMLEELTQ